MILFTSDHGEYGGSHGLRGKGAAAYEEAIRVPLIVKDPRGVLTSAPEQTRTQLSSSVDVAPLLLTIATGSKDWRRERPLLSPRRPPGPRRDPRRPDAPGTALRAARHRRDRHRVRDRTVRGRRAAARGRDAHARCEVRHLLELARRASTPLAQGQESELYDYRTHGGRRWSCDNSAGHGRLEEPLRTEYERALHEELRGPLPARLGAAHRRGFTNYFSNATTAAAAATARRKRRSERELGQLAGNGVIALPRT